jgi:hypothetical protein
MTIVPGEEPTLRKCETAGASGLAPPFLKRETLFLC